MFSFFNSEKRKEEKRRIEEEQRRQRLQQEEKLLSNPDIKKIIDRIIYSINSNQKWYKDRIVKDRNSIFYGVYTNGRHVTWGDVNMDGWPSLRDPEKWWDHVGNRDTIVYFSSIGIKDLNEAQIDLLLDVIQKQIIKNTTISRMERFNRYPDQKMIYADITDWAKSASQLKSLI